MRTCLAALVTATTVAACRLGPGVCDTDIEPAIDVAIVHALTGAPLADSALGLVRAGAFVDTLRPNRGDGAGHLLSRAASQTPPGTYEVIVTRQGYHPWILTNVRVRAGDCGVQTRVLTAELQPESAP